MPGPAKSFDPDAALDRAVEVFNERGFEAAGMAELLERMGIARKSLYDTFGNKRQLFLAAVDRYGRRAAQSVAATIDAAPSPLAGVRAVLDAWAKAQAGPCTRGCMIGTCIADFGTDDPEVAGLLRRHLDAIEGVLRTALEAARTRGELRVDATPRDLARLLVSVSQGMALVGRVHETPTFTRSVVAAARAALGPA